jgi:hypothetical protein
LKYKDKSILDYWKCFKDVRVAASLDTFEQKAEYARKGTDWNKIVSNRKTMIDHCPNVYFEITPTISIFSVHSLYEFHRSWVEEGLLDIDNVRINILTHPRYFSITILPKEYKRRIEGLYNAYVKWLQDNNSQLHVVQSINGIVDYMNSADHSNLISDFKSQIQIIDNVRNERFVEIYPELENL